MRTMLSLAERFARHYRQDESGCWIWTGATNARGYGKLGYGGRKERNGYAHRISYELHHGPIPPDRWVLHRCDVTGCVNPDHLFLGTALDNTKDCIAKGRDRRGIHPGEINGRAKIAAGDVFAIRLHKRLSNKQAGAIAEALGISASQVKNIHSGRTWKHIE